MDTIRNTEGTQSIKPEVTNKKFCKHCGDKIDIDCIICPKCGKKVEELKGAAKQPKIEVNVSQNQSSVNTNTNNIHAGMLKASKNKLVALCLCFFLGFLGGHKFYEGKAGMGILYSFTLGLFGIGILIDFIVLLFKPSPHYV
jgi:hypothetical protein